MTRSGVVVRLAVLALLVAAPALLDTYNTFLLTEILIFGLFAASLDLLIGYSGLPSLGHGGYYGVGAYAAGLLALHATTNAFAQIGGRDRRGGGRGARDGRLRRALPRRLLRDADARVRAAALGARAQLDVADGRLERDLRDRGRRRSRAARSCSRRPTTSTGTSSASSSSATRSSGSSCARRSAARSRRSARTSRAPRSLGYNVQLYKLAVFTIAGAVAGYAGSLACQQPKYFSPDGMSFEVSAVAVVAIVIGGQRSLIGAVLGAAFYYILRDRLSDVLSSHWQLVLGVSFVLVVYLLAFVGGLVGGAPAGSRAEARRDDGRAGAAGRSAAATASCAPSTRVTLAVEAGSRHAVIGPNGAGKSTLFHLISGTVRPTSGRVRFAGADVTRWGPHRRTRLGMGRTFQHSSLFDGSPARENVAIAVQRKLGHAHNLVVPTARYADVDARSEELLALVGLGRPRRRRGRVALLRSSPAARGRARPRDGAGAAAPRRADRRHVAGRGAAVPAADRRPSRRS